MPCTEAQLRAIKKWRHNNYEIFNKTLIAYRTRHIDEVRERDRKRKMYFYQCKIFRNILIN